MSRRIPLEAITDNPIFVRELRRRMRGKAMIFSTNAYIFFMCLVAAGVLIFQVGLGKFTNFGQGESPGKFLFSSIVVVQAILVMLIAPTITSGMATAERERKTFDFLRVTTLSPLTFVMGGLLSTMLYALVVLVCALPLLSISFLYGGVAPSEIVLIFSLLVALALVLSSAGMLISSTRDKTKNAQGATMVFVILAGLAFLNFFKFSSVLDLRDKLLERVMLFGRLYVPVWLMLGVGVLALSGLLLMVAARKLYVSEARPLAYRHTLAIFGVVSLLFLGWPWGTNNLRQWNAWTYYTMLFFFVATTSHCLHRLEVGSDVWALKKRLSALRSFDESVPFVGLLAVAWTLVSYLWMQGSPDGIVESPAFWPMLQCFVAMTLFMAISARCLAWRANDRAAAFKQALYLWGTVLFVVPLLARLWFWSDTEVRPVADAIIYLSPYMQWHDYADMLYQQFAKPPEATAASFWGATAIYAVGCVCFGAAALYYNRLNRQPVDYSYALTV